MKRRILCALLLSFCLTAAGLADTWTGHVAEADLVDVEAPADGVLSGGGANWTRMKRMSGRSVRIRTMRITIFIVDLFSCKLDGDMRRTPVVFDSRTVSTRDLELCFMN